jgi:protein ImuB
VELRDGTGRAVRVDGRGFLTGTPTHLVFERGQEREISWHAGPWPTVERWWSARRRRAYLQVLTPTEALLLVAEGARWWLAGVYD